MMPLQTIKYNKSSSKSPTTESHENFESSVWLSLLLLLVAMLLSLLLLVVKPDHSS